MDVGTSFGGLGSSREMIAALAEPAMLMVIFSVAILVRTTSLSLIVDFMLSGVVGLRVSLALALISLLMVAIAENGRVPIDNPATHLELTMVHEAMVLEYSGRHLALIEAASMLKLVLYMALIACIFLPWGSRNQMRDRSTCWSVCDLRAQTGRRRRSARGVRNRHREDAGVPLRRVPRRRLLLSLLAAIFLYVSTGL